MIQLRPFQKRALEALDIPVSQSRHVLCISPTGSGKSLIYERASAHPQRRTLLITPLVALARQQYSKLKALGIPVTLGAGGSSENPPSTRSGVWIISPELLHFSGRQAVLQKWKPNFLVVDECHCLWEWGESFRPAFSMIPHLIKSYSIPQSLWLTATLPYEARVSLIQSLPQPPIEIGEFDLPKKLQLHIQQVPWENRTHFLLQKTMSQNEAGIVFVATRDDTRRISRLIQATGKRVLTYHGGMSAEERKNTEALIAKELPDIIVATSAFGMGMDYRHLKFVVLWQAPTSLLSLVQTVGRVGRDSNSIGSAWVFWDYEDFRLLEWTIQGSLKRKNELMKLLQFLKERSCRKASLRRYFDGTSHLSLMNLKNNTGNPASAQPCGICDFCLTSQIYTRRTL